MSMHKRAVADRKLVCEHVTSPEYGLDVDPRYWNKDEGEFEFDGLTYHFSKREDHFVIRCAGLTFRCERP